MAGNSSSVMPGLLRSRYSFVGLSIQKRKGHEATAMRSRGAVGKAMCGARGAARRVVLRIGETAVAAPAAATIPSEFLRNERRDKWLMQASATVNKDKQYFTGIRQEVTAQRWRLLSGKA